MLPREVFFDAQELLPNYWQVFGVRPSGTTDAKMQKTVVKRFRELAVKLHPDKNMAGDTLKEFQRIAAAKEVLMNEEARRKYVRKVERKIGMSLESWAAKRARVKEQKPSESPPPKKPRVTPRPFVLSECTHEEIARLEKSLAAKLADLYPSPLPSPDFSRYLSAMDRVILSRIGLGTIQSLDPTPPEEVTALYLSNPVKYWYLRFASGQGSGYLYYCAKVDVARSLFDTVVMEL
eukprot:TRINITY_DN36988_c0_g1_i1.p1 TRINITY_DN36988_c0_g1~~TRINITY_DN36988_c0_g1_i1.p1  ORF type:complete len:235 (+),score=32.55 TRINITY_DN36988_c0_g1_i1:20-724(+)